MRKMIAFYGIAAFFAVVSCSQTPQPAAAQKTGAAIEFETTEHDFGTIPFKGDGTFEFVFRNTGKEPLLLTNVRSSCGCTVPEWPKEPVNKGKQGVIKVRYNTRISGNFAKSISVYTNTGEGPIVLVIRGKVEAPPAASEDATDK
jgi:hypothetical protein